jgi:protein TonB
MRLLTSFAGACLMALALFALMLYLVAPPRQQPVEDPLTVANFVRMAKESSDSASRSRQQAPQPPQAKTPQPPTPPTPTVAPAAQLPSLDLELPSLGGSIALSGAPAPSLNGLNAAAASEPSDPGDAGGPPALESEVVPLNEVRPEYPDYAIRRGIEGHVKLAFTITRGGSVENIRVLEAEPSSVFEREARRAAARWRFAPRTENGLAVSREAVKTLYFRLKKEG